MSSFIQYQRKVLGAAGGGGDVGLEAAKKHDRLTDQLFTD